MVLFRKKQTCDGRRKKDNRIEVLLDNKVDTDIQSMLLPLNLMQYVLFSPKYSLKNNFITTNSFISSACALLVVLCFILVFAYRIYFMQSNKIMTKYFPFLYLSSYPDIIFYSIGFINNFLMNIVESQRNIRFVLIYQDVHRSLSIGTGKENSLKKFVVWNWTCIIIIFSFFIISENYLYFSLHLPHYFYFTSLLIICFDANVVYAIGLLRILIDKLLLFNTKIRSLTTQGAGKTHCIELFQIYVNIMQCYEHYIMSFQKSVR